MATEVLTYVADGFLGHTSQDWTKSPPSGNPYYQYVTTDNDGKFLGTLAFQADHGSGTDDWTEVNFIASDPTADNIDAVTNIVWSVSYVSTLITASWVKLGVELRQASTGNLITSSSGVILASDGTWHRGVPFPDSNGLTVNLTAAEADDLAVKWKVWSSNGLFLGAFFQTDFLGPTITYTELVLEDIVSIRSPISMTPALASAIANAPAVSSSTTKTPSVSSTTSKTVSVNSTTSKTVSVDSKRT